MGLCEHLTIVADEVFSGGKDYEGDTLRYLREMGALHCDLARRADRVVEVACGMTTLQGYTHVVLPQAFRLAIPSLMNNFIECFKGSALCSMVGVVDMMLRAKMLANKSFRFIEVYLCVLLLYWVINMIFVAIQKVIEQKANAKY